MDAGLDFQLKLFRWPDPGPHIIALVKGTINNERFTRIFREVAEMAQPLARGRILIDLVEATYAPDFGDLDELTHGVEWDQWTANFSIAIVSGRDIEQYNWVRKFRTLLSNRGVNVETFISIKVAVDWLVEKT
jgi:hypothetical protein